ncbi:MAG: hypothetical protein IH606_20155 [Burkholderiales bacterium]|nr:hypothetical protein [Burkholderiales bacterium]
MSDKDERTNVALRAGLAPFLARISAEEWRTRRERILEWLKGIMEGSELEKAKPVRVRDDEIGWYLFLCEQALEDPMCIDISQAQRALPFFVGIGERWKHSTKVKGLERKIDEVLHNYKSAPDGLIFEILVALSYAANGWDVELLEQSPPAKSPDMVVRKDGRELYIECKRQDRRTAYSETERNHFLRMWEAAKHVLIKNSQWAWFKGTFHAEASALPTEFLKEIFQSALPLGSGERLIHDSADATIFARLIDRYAVIRHMAQYHVKANSPALSALLGGDWAPPNSPTTIIHLVKTSHVIDCEVRVLGTYIDEIAWASGFTREFDSDVSIDKKARDVTKHLADAVKQVPSDKPSIIHLAAETMEGKDVELRRTEKVMATIPSFITDKPVIAVRFHRFQGNQTTDKLFEFDETVNKFQIDGARLDDIPFNVVVPDHVAMQRGSHWELYQ